MTAKPENTDALFAEIEKVDVLELAGRILTDPRRVSISTVGGLALALAVERFWDVCVEANVLVTALEMTMPWAEDADPEHCERVAIASGHIRNLMNALTGDETLIATE